MELQLVFVILVIGVSFVLANEAEDAANSEIKKQEAAGRTCSSYHKDIANFEECNGFKLQFYQSYVDASKKCDEDRDKNDDYTCYKICQFKALGVLTQDGELDEPKTQTHFKELFGSNQDLQDKALAAIRKCINGKVTNSAADQLSGCSTMLEPLMCMKKEFSDICHPDTAKNPALVQLGKDCKSKTDQADG